MPIYSTLEDFIKNGPKFKIPYDYLQLYYLINDFIDSPDDNDYYYQTKKQFVEDRYGDLTKINIDLVNNDKKSLLTTLQQDNDFTIFRNGKIIYNENIPDDMIICYNCGNVWDGNAQCMCDRNQIY